MSRLLCIAIVSETYVAAKNHYVMGRKRMVECALPMQEGETSLYTCTRGHKQYFPYDASELKSKLHAKTKDGEAYLK